MRDPGGARQLSPDPPALDTPIAICPTLALPGDAAQNLSMPGYQIGGDFAQLYTSLGGIAPRPLADALAVYGAPLGPIVQELAGDCQTITSVLYTERQRLELHPELDWPYRVSGSQIGALIYQQKYGRAPQRRTNLDGDAIANERFKAFFEAYGGLAVFGYPISPAFEETEAGQPKTVQYFERARFELAPAGASLLEQVRLGALGREYPGIAAQCPGQPVALAAARPPAGTQPSPGTPVAPPALTAREQAASANSAPSATLVAPPAGRAWWFWLLAGLIGLLLLGTIAWGWQIRADLHARQMRAARALQRRSAAAPGAVPARPSAPIADAELLRRLLGE
jgi:hypothetical protein